jgi:hypothetical protein
VLADDGRLDDRGMLDSALSTSNGRCGKPALLINVVGAADEQL